MMKQLSAHSYRRVLLISLLCRVALSNAPAVHVPGQQVTYHGSAAGPIEHFQGIRYARDTSGERRFAPPERYVPEIDTVVNASHAGSVCPQVEAAMPLFFDETSEMSEDCLNLRVARPAGITSDDKLPVVVFLHGGGALMGSAYDSHLSPDDFLQLSITDGTPVIYAAINYRLSIFGFPRLPLLKEQKSLNLGARDQRLGLQWIQENIHAFGGDPERITLYGLSIGATFAGMHTLAYGGQHGAPFQQAWLMSGPPGTSLNMTSDATNVHTRIVAERLDCGDRGDLEVLSCLREVPMRDLLDTALTYSRENHPPLGAFTFIPSVDGDFYPDSQSHLVRDGRFVKGIKMVFGWTQDDGAVNIGDGRAIQSEEDMVGPVRALASDLSEAQLFELFALYPATAFQHELENYDSRRAPSDPTISVHFLRVSRILRDLLFTCPSIEYGYQMVNQTREIQPGFDSVRLYNLNQSVFTPMMAGAGRPYLGAIHGSDTPYLFNGFPEGNLSETDQELAAHMCRSFINFAYTGTPTPSTKSSKQSSDWPPAYPSPVSSATGPIPPSFNIQVIGGPYGTGPVSVKDERSVYKFVSQNILGSILNFAGMGSASDTIRQQSIYAEDLHRRCAYLSSLDEVLGR